MIPSPEREGRLLPVYRKANKGKTKEKGTEPRTKSPKRKSDSCPECGVLWAGAQCGVVVKDKVFLRKLYLNRWGYWEARKAQQLLDGRGAGSSIPVENR